MRREDRQLWERVARTVDRRPGGAARTPFVAPDVAASADPFAPPSAPARSAPDPRPAPARKGLRNGAAAAPRRAVLPSGSTEPDAAALDALRRWWAATDGRMEAAEPAAPASRADAAARARALPRPVAPGVGAPSLDRHQQRRLARGRTPIERRVDLHGLTEAAAHRRLLEFLHGARSDGLRSVLVITGKGASKRGGEGALKRAVPRWLATSPFSPLVSGIAPAARHDGGEGALYVRLRR